MNIRQKLRLSVLLLVVAFVTLVGTIAYTLRVVQRAALHLEQVNDAVRLVFELSIRGYEYQAYHEESSLRQWRAAHHRLGTRLAAMAAEMRLSWANDTLRRLHENHALLRRLFEATVSREQPPESVRLSLQSLLLHSNGLATEAHELAAASHQRIVAQTVTLLLICLASLLPLTLACAFICLAHRRILSSLATLHAGATTIAHGHLSHTISVPGQDEFALLARTINTMASQLHVDITRREQTQTQVQHYAQQLAARNAELAQLATIVASSTDAIIGMSLDGKIVSWNAGAERLYGYTAQEVHDQHISRLIPPDRVDELSHALDTVQHGAFAAPYETVRLRKDGQPIHVSVSISPLYDAAGQVVGAAGIGRDLTESRLAREQFRGLLEANPDAMVIADQAGNIVMVNTPAEKLFGYARWEMLGQSVELLLPEHEHQTHTVYPLHCTGAPDMQPMGTSGTLYALHKDGHTFPVEVSLAPLHTAEGLLISSVIYDVTTRKKAEIALAQAIDSLAAQNRLLIETRDQALQATRAKSAFLATMSHEIRTPMHAILGMADLLEESPLNAVQQDYVQRFKKAGKHLLTLINDILDLSKIEAGYLELEHIPFDLTDLLQTVVELVAGRAQAKELALLCIAAPDIPTALLGDPHRLRQILVNLLSNAIKFTDTGTVTLSVQTEGQHPGGLRFTVRDTGIGIPGDKLATIFESFTQVDTSTTRKYGGTGLGLSICKHIVGLMGGQISVDSQVGRGSTFSFTAHFTLDTAPAKPTLSLSVPLHGRRVLVVDNNATNRLIVREMLAGSGALVSEAEGAEAGLRAVTEAQQAERPFHVILVDGAMPDKDGFDFLTQLRPIQRSNTAALLMLASDHRPGDRARCQALGVSHYLLKPLARATLLQAVTAALAQQGEADLVRHAGPEMAPLQSGNALKILVADDNEDNQMLIQAYLRRTSHQLTLANDGASAVEQFMAGDFDLVLMDVQMPIMDGYSATARIRQWEQAQQRTPTRIVALTAHALTEDKLRSQEAGCNGHLTKPLKKATLLKTLEECSSSLAHPV